MKQMRLGASWVKLDFFEQLMSSRAHGEPSMRVDLGDLVSSWQHSLQNFAVWLSLVNCIEQACKFMRRLAIP